MNIVQQFMVFLLLVFVGCTSVEVVPIPASEKLSEISIKENPKVIVDDYLPLVERMFHEHGIKTHLFKETEEAPTPYILTYTALRTWDVVTFLSHAEVKLEKNGKTIGSAVYHLRGKGGFSMMKWQGVETKMTPVLEELLQYYEKIKNVK